MIKEILNKIQEKLNLKTDSKIVKGWVKKFNLPDYFVMVLWKRAICAFLQDGKKGCKPKDSDWSIITNIFKAEVKKYLSKVDDDIKHSIKNPTIDGKKAKIHYEETKKISLKKVIKSYEDELKKCCEKCKSICDS